MKKMMGMVALVTAAVAGNSWAQGARTLDLAPQPLAEALQGLAGQTGIQILFDAAELQSAPSRGLQGSLTPEAALQKLLQDTDFVFHSTAPGSYVIQRRSRSGNVLPEVLVHGQRLRAETEGSGTYAAAAATVAGKVALTPREIPQSVSVLTRQQMDDQGMVTMVDALQQVTGVNVIANDTTQSQYLSRGFSLGVMQDGVPSHSGLTAVHQFDLALYDRVEVLRGPAGILQGTSEPGGVVNLVKKRPRDTFAAAVTASTGSWNNNRVEGDITAPLNAERSLRGRLVVSDEDRHYYYDRARTNKWLAFGALEYDLSPATTLSLSFAAQDSRSKAPSSGLPKYKDGNFLKVDRSTNVVPDWVVYSYYTEETSASVEHRFANKWVAKASYSHRTQNSFSKDAWPSSGVNRATGTVDAYNRSQYTSDDRRDGLDAFINGPFDLFGRTHNLLLGVNAEVYNSRSKSGSASTVANVSLADAASLPEPSFTYTSGSESERAQSGVYSQLRLSLADPVTLVLGGRATNFKAKSRNVSPSTQSAWRDGAQANNQFTPYGGLIVDVTRQVSLYGSYADIFVPQTQLKADGNALDPRVGKQYEVGSKGEFFDGRLNASLAFFNIRDKNRAYRDPAYPAASTPYYLNAGEIESKGWEAEVSGSPMAGLELMAGYTRLETRYLSDRTLQGKEYSIQSPRDSLKLWANYRFNQDSLRGLNLGLGTIVSSGAGSSRGNRNVETQGGYAVVNALVGYQIDKNYSVSLAANNLFDRNYYATVGTFTAYNFYGEPRNLMLTFRARY